MSDNCEKSLEPAAWLVKCECDDQWTHLIDNPEDLPYVPDYCPDCESRLQSEPLVRCSEIRHRLQVMLHTPLDEDETMTQRVNHLWKELEEFTQLSEAE